MQRKCFPVGQCQSVRGASPTDAEIPQDDGRTGVEKVYKLVPKSSRNERWLSDSDEKEKRSVSLNSTTLRERKQAWLLWKLLVCLNRRMREGFKIRGNERILTYVLTWRAGQCEKRCESG